MRSQALRSAAVRVGVLRLFLLAFFIVLAGRAAQLTLVSPTAKRQGQSQIHARIVLPPARGLILDREHKELAISVEAPSVYVLPQLLGENADTTTAQLARALGLENAALRKRIAERKGFTYVARWIADERARAVAALDLAGVGVEQEPRRTYPAGGLAAALIGFADIDGNGVRGIEQMLDAWLRGEPRTLAVERDAAGRLLCSNLVDPRVTAGGDVVLSIDAGLQAQAEAALAQAVEETGAQGGIVIAVDPATGDLLSLAEAPGYDPNDFRRTAYAETRSRAFLDVVEPGSTMKALLTAAALEAGVIDTTTQFDTGEGWVRVPGKTIRDHHAYGVLDTAGVLRLSSNVAAIQIAQRLGPEAHHASLLRFGFGAATKSGFPSESSGLLRDWRGWKSLDQAAIAFGQGISVTPIQLAMAIAALGNEGELMQPRLLLARRRPLQGWQETHPVSRGHAVSPETARRVVAMLETVVSGQGTGRKAGLAGVRVAGKTGTAQKLDADGGYSQTRYTAWFAGLAPADAPRIAVVVALDEPKGDQHTGGAVAAPLFATVAAGQLANLGIITRPQPIPAEKIPTLELARKEPPSPVQAKPTPAASPPKASRATASKTPAAPPIVVAAAGKPVRAIAEIAPAAVTSAPPGWSPLDSQDDVAHLRSVLVPDFHGGSLADAKRLAARESLDLRVDGSGDGFVVDQSPAAGTIVGGSQRTVVLRFRARRGEG